MTTRTLAGAACAAALLLAGSGDHPADGEAPACAVLQVAATDVVSVEKYPAAIRGRQDVDIYAQVEGRITVVCVTEGRRVVRGQTLFVVDQVPYRAALQTAQANERAARAARDAAALDYDGKQALRAQQVASDFEVRKAHSALQQADAALQQARAQVADARNRLSYTTVSSPCDGVVGTLPYRVGALVGPTSPQPLTTVSDNITMHVYFSVPEGELLAWARRHGSARKALEARPRVSLYLSDGSAYGAEGTVESMSGVLDAATGSLQLRAAFPNPDGLLHSGGAGAVGLRSERRGVVAVPRSATRELQDKVFVYRLLHGKAVATRIEVTPVDEQGIYVVERGLKPGGIIVAEGVGLLRDGMSVTVEKEER